MTQPEQTIDCLYSCPLCGLEKVSVKLPAREEGQGVVEWMQQVCIVKLGEDHGKRSPFCHPKELKDVMIPITGAEYIGGPSVS